MEVDELAPWHFDTSAKDGVVRVMLSDDWVKRYEKIYERLKEVTAIISLDVDVVERLADRLIGFLTVDLGEISVRLSLFALALYTICKKVVVTGYRVARTPAVFGKAVYGKTQYGRGGYTIEPTLEAERGTD